jgi:hypothetical protein
MCFVWLSEQTAIISLYSINWLVCITETEWVYCAVRTGYLNVIWVICFIWIWEQTAIISLYSINWLVCITETECVYCAVRTGYLNVILVISFIWIWEQTAIISLYSINWLVCITETECVYSAVRIGSLYEVQVNLSLSGCAWPSGLVVGLPPRSTGVDPRQVYVRYAVYNVALGEDFLWVLRFLSASITPPEGQTAKVRKPCKKQRSLENR